MGKGLLYFDEDSETFAHWSSRPEVAGALSQDNVLSLELDLSGVLWIAGDKGIDLWIRSRDRFEVWRHLGDSDFGLPSPNVSALLQDRRGRLWIGGQNGNLGIYEGRKRLRSWRAGERGGPQGMMRALVGAARHHDAASVGL